MNHVTLAQPRGIHQWLQLYRLYLSAFPVRERKPFSIIMKMYRKGKSDVWCIIKEQKILGFAATINAEKLILLDYLAVDQKHRSEGIGSSAIQELLRIYNGKGIFVEIESPCEDAPNQKERLLRKRFYLNCGMNELNVTAEVFGVRMDLLGRSCTLTFENYQSFYRENYSPRAAEHISKVPGSL